MTRLHVSRTCRSAAVLAAVLLSGCAGLSHHHRPPATKPPSLATIDGYVLHRGSLPLPPNGLTLRQALVEAGGFYSDDPAHLPADCLVALHRKRTPRDEMLYFPLVLVTSDLAGSVLLGAGDHVRLVNWRTTSLNPLVPLNSSSEEAREGIVREYHVLGAGSMSEEPRQTNPETQLILHIDELRGPKQRLSEGTVVIVRRVNSQGFLETFVLPPFHSPYRGASGSDSVLLPITYNNEMFTHQAIYEQDSYEVTTLEQIPLILSGLLTPVIHAALFPSAAQPGLNVANRSLPMTLGTVPTPGTLPVLPGSISTAGPSALRRGTSALGQGLGGLESLPIPCQKEPPAVTIPDTAGAVIHPPR